MGPWLPPMTQVGASEGGKSPQVVSTWDCASLSQEKRRPLPSPQAPGGRGLSQHHQLVLSGALPHTHLPPSRSGSLFQEMEGSRPPSLSSLRDCFRSHRSVMCLAASERSHPWPFPFLPAVPPLVTAVSFADERERPRGNHLCGEEGKEQRALGDRTGQAQT